MKLKRILISTAAGVLSIITGCATVVKEEAIGGNPPLGQQAEVQVGDPIYKFTAYGAATYDEFSKGYNKYSRTYSDGYAGGQGGALELLYSGVSQGRLNVTYREFSASNADTGALIRPAFQQEVQYDYVPGMEIAFKGLKMTVYRADQSSIQYVVVQGFRDEDILRQQAKCATWIAMRATTTPIAQPPGCSASS